MLPRAKDVARTARCLGVSYDFQRIETKWTFACSACSTCRHSPEGFSAS